ncbi:MAG: MATE family efflux transporter [Thermoplasmatota archaeon]
MKNTRKTDVSHLEQPENNKTNGVETLLGDPKKAILKLSIPMVIAMTVSTIYNLVDAAWVSGLGSDALAAVGFVYPFFYMAIAIANGLGIGAGSAISRRIGADDKDGADSVAAHSVIIMIIISFLFTLILFVFAREIFTAIGAGDTIDLAVIYARIMSIGAVIIFFSFIANAILRAEGDAKRAMYSLGIGAILNMILDPIFIYTFNLGVAGAAWATLVSMSVSSLLMFYWLFSKKDTYVSIHFRKFKFNKSILKDIFSVGFPSSIMQLSMSINMLIINLIIIQIGIINAVENPQDNVAIFTAGWRVGMLATMPLVGISTAVVSVSGALYGAYDYVKLKIAFIYAIKIGFVIELAIALFVFFFAPQITLLFTLSDVSAHLAPGIIEFLRIICIFFPIIAFGMLSSSMFQGIGKGKNALIVTIFRTIILSVPIIWFLSITLNLQLSGAWWGVVIANLIGSVIAFLWAHQYITKIQKKSIPQIQ